MLKKIKKEEFENNFLKSLLEIPDCPEELFYKGNLPLKENTKFITIVGSRRHSVYAKDALEKLISELAGYNIIIISGLALGVDSIAHSQALKHHLKTITVPGSGLGDNVLYPRSNFNLSKQILDNGGLLLSEFEENFKATPWSFPKRNRIMAGISDLVLVVEAKEKSGTLITARLALDYNKDLAVIPNSIFSEYSKGSNSLLKQGAHPIFSGEDILNLLGFDKQITKQEKLNLDDFSEIEQKILNTLSEPKTKIEIQKELNIDITKLNTEISILELKGIIKESLGKFRKI